MNIIAWTGWMPTWPDCVSLASPVDYRHILALILPSIPVDCILLSGIPYDTMKIPVSLGRA